MCINFECFATIEYLVWPAQPVWPGRGGHYVIERHPPSLGTQRAAAVHQTLLQGRQEKVSRYM